MDTFLGSWKVLHITQKERRRVYMNKQFFFRGSKLFWRWGGLAMIAMALVISSVFAVKAQATEFKLSDDFSLTAKGTFTVGAAMRTNSANEETVNSGNAQSIGKTGNAPRNAARNMDDANLNWRRGDIVSSVAKGVLSGDLKYKNVGLFVRGKAWYDYTLDNKDVPYGNEANNYTRDAPLGDANYDRRARAMGVDLGETYIYGSLSKMSIKAGYQNFNWGIPSSFVLSSGISEINPIDFNSAVRPGMVPEEVRIAIPAISAKIGFGPDVPGVGSLASVEAFYQLMYRANEMNGCGSFYMPSDVGFQSSCNKLLVDLTGATRSDRDVIAAGYYINRGQDILPKDDGQFGFAGTVIVPQIKTRIGAYFANFHSRNGYASTYKATHAPVGPQQLYLVPNMAGNPVVVQEYPENIQTYALNFVTRLPSWDLSGELTYRPNAIFGYSFNEVTAASVSQKAQVPAAMRAKMNSLAPGGLLEGYDRHQLLQLQLRGGKDFRGFLGADNFRLGAEIEVKYVPDLPDVMDQRYGRADAWGMGPIRGQTVACGVADCNAQNSTDGYVTAWSYGYRIRGVMTYKNVVTGLDLIPSLSFAHDVKGWSQDNVFSQGRQFMDIRLRGEYKTNYFAEIQYWPTWGGDYNVAKDRSFAMASMGVKF
jgi:hypothetical protein